MESTNIKAELDEDQKELLQIFEELDPENRLNILAHFRVALSAQQNALKAMAAEKPEKRETA